MAVSHLELQAKHPGQSDACREHMFPKAGRITAIGEARRVGFE